MSKKHVCVHFHRGGEEITHEKIKTNITLLYCKPSK